MPGTCSARKYTYFTVRCKGQRRTSNFKKTPCRCRSGERTCMIQWCAYLSDPGMCYRTCCTRSTNACMGILVLCIRGERACNQHLFLCNRNLYRVSHVTRSSE